MRVRFSVSDPQLVGLVFVAGAGGTGRLGPGWLADGLVQPPGCHTSRVASARARGKVPARRARAVSREEGLVGVFGVGDGLFGHETVPEHLPQRDRCVVGPDNGGGPLDYRRPGDA